MANTAILAIRIVSDATSAAKGMDQTTAKASRMSKVSAAAGKVMAVGFVAAAAGLVKLTKGAAEDAAAQSKLAGVLRGAAGATDAQVKSTEKWISAQGKALGVTDDELRPALAKLVSVTGDVGKAQKLAALAMDVSAGSGASLQSVTKALARAQDGNVSGLAKLGVRTKDASGKTKSLVAIQKDLARTYGGAATKAAGTAEGKQKRLMLTLSELGEEVGARLIPALTKLANIGLKMVDWVSRNQTTTAALVGTLASLLVITYAVGKAMAVYKAITTVIAAATKVWTAVQWAFNAAMAANPVGLVVLAVVALVAALVLAYKKSETFRAICQGAMNAVRGALSNVVAGVRNLVGWIRDRAGGAFTVWRTIAVTAFRVVTAPTRTLIRVIGTLVGWVRDRAPAAWAVLRDRAVAVWSRIREGMATMRDRLATIATNARERVVAPFLIVKTKVAGVWTNIKEGFGTMRGRLENAATTLKTNVVNQLEQMLSPITTLIQKVKDLIGWIKDIKFPKIPKLPGVGRVAAKAGPTGPMAGTGRYAAAGGQTVIYNIDVHGILDGDQAAAVIRRTLERHDRKVGRR